MLRGCKLNPGIYYNYEFDKYLEIDAVSNSALGALNKSPRHYKLAMPLEKQKHLVLGNMVHTARLEPDAFAKRYTICPDYHNDELNVTASGERSTSKQTKYVKERIAQFHESAPCEVVPAEWYQEMMFIVNSLYTDYDANALFNAPGPFELTLVWEDPETGILCKGRMDKLCDRDGCFGDLKTCADILKFQKSFTDYDYARQMAHYRAGYAVLTGELLEAKVCVIEKSAPYCSMTCPVDEDSIEWGESEQRRLLRLLADSREADTWPGPEPPEAWRVADWKLDQGKVELSIGGVTVEV